MKDKYYCHKYDALALRCYCCCCYKKKIQAVQPLVSHMKQLLNGLFLSLGLAHNIGIHRKSFHLAFVVKSLLPLNSILFTNLHAQNCALVS